MACLYYLAINLKPGSSALSTLLRNLLGNMKDLAPLVFVIAFFELAVLRQPIPNLVPLLIGFLLVLAGLIVGSVMLITAALIAAG